MSTMAWRGHFTAHWPQERQRLSSISERFSFTVIAPAGHAFAHRPQPMQLTSHICRASFPASRFEHLTTMGFSRSWMEMTSRGHSFAHLPQPMQRSLSTSATPAPLISMASNGQTLTHTPQPTQPYRQSAVARQPPEQATTAYLGDGFLSLAMVHAFLSYGVSASGSLVRRSPSSRK